MLAFAQVYDEVLVGRVAELGTDRFGPDLIEARQGLRRELVAVIADPPIPHLGRVTVRRYCSDDFGPGNAARDPRMGPCWQT